MSARDVRRFEHLTFEDFRVMATDDTLSRHEKVGFPNSYREGKERAIFDDIRSKLPMLLERERLVVEIGPGCSDLPRMLVDLCARSAHELVLVDSHEMLSQLPTRPFVRKVEGRFPADVSLTEYRERVDVLLVYSVLHYVFAEGNVVAFLDRLLELLAPGGSLLLGDIPNVSKRKRFFSSAAGVAFHQEFTGTQARPEADFNRIERDKIDDAIVLSLVARARASGFDAYVLPQPSSFPMANRREDVLVTRP